MASGRAIPSGELTNEKLETMVETSDEWIFTRTGIKARRICEGEENCTYLAVQAARKAIEQAEERDSSFSRDKIGAVIVATSSADRYLPSTACMIQKELGLSTRILPYDLTAACSGFVYGVYTAAALMETHKMEYTLVVGSEFLSAITDFRDRSTCILFGDGAGAGIFTLEENEVPFVGKTWAEGNELVLGCNHGGKIYMDGQEVYKFATRVIGKSIEGILEEAKLSLADIDYVVCHQANARILEHVKKKYKDYADKFYMNIENYGNTSAASIPMALDEMNEKGMLQPGGKLILAGFGGGLTWGSVLITT